MGKIQMGGTGDDFDSANTLVDEWYQTIQCV